MSDTASKKRLIEEDFPLREVSEESAHEKNIRSGIISTLHIWWARRPLAASRATILAALLPDDVMRRKEYLELIRNLCPWEVVAKNTPQNQLLLEKARRLILAANGGETPRVLDCFGGGGAIPLEALRLGCATHAIDYNPVAVLIEKAVLEYPQKFGALRVVRGTQNDGLGIEGHVNPLLEGIKCWGDWVFAETCKELFPFYPKDDDGSVPVGYIWTWTIPCQNSECGAEIPLIRQTWLANKGREKVALRILSDKARRCVSFEVVEGKCIDFPPDEGTVTQAHVRCPVCGNTIDDNVTRRLVSENKSGQRMVAVVLSHPNRSGKKYRLATRADTEIFEIARRSLLRKQSELFSEWGTDPLPNEMIPTTELRRLSVPLYGLTKFSDLYNARQQLALMTFAQKVRKAHGRMVEAGLDREFAKAISTFLALTFDKLAMFTSNICLWKSDTIQARPSIAIRQAIQMVWDYFEMNPISGVSASWPNLIEVCMDSMLAVPTGGSFAVVSQGSATTLNAADASFDAVITDPPYYDSVPYSHLSDFFYVWLKRTVGELYPDLFATPLTPKSLEIVQDRPHRLSDSKKDKAFFERTLTQSFKEICRVLKPDGIAVIVFAHKSTEAWEAIINALLSAGLFMTASWPIHTELGTRLNAQETASLASSIYMVCRKRVAKEIGEFPQVKAAIDQRIRQKLDEFWNAGIRGADLFMSAIGPAVEVFGRYERVEKLSGETVSVPELLDYVEKVVSEFALERILGSAELGGVDPDTRFYLLWRWTFSGARVPFDEARKLANAVGTELTILWEEGRFVSKEKEYVRALGPKDREKNSKFMNQIGFNTMVDALHRACIYWERGERKQLKEHLAQTYGANNIFWRVAQNIADVLPEGDKEKQLLQGLLNVPEARDKVVAGSGKLFSE
jgi:putative DNA methylase